MKIFTHVAALLKREPALASTDGAGRHSLSGSHAPLTRYVRERQIFRQHMVFREHATSQR